MKRNNAKCACSNLKHHAKWTLNVKGIEKSIESIFKTGDMVKLTKDAYKFVMGESGFIAHYNHNGFIAEYQNDIDRFRRKLHDAAADWKRYKTDSCFAESDQKDYYAQKSELLRNLAVLCQSYAKKTFGYGQELTQKRIALTEAILAKAKAEPGNAKDLMDSLFGT